MRLEGKATGGAGARPSDTQEDRAPRRVTLLRAAAFASTRQGSEAPTPPLELLGLATALRDQRGLFGGMTPRLRLFDSSIEEPGDGDSIRGLARESHAVVMGVDNLQTGGELAAPLGPAVEAGRQLRGGQGPVPFTLALLQDDEARADRLLDAGAADIVFRGEGDDLVPGILSDALGGRTDWAGTRGVSWRKPDGEIAHESAAPSPLHPAAPAWDLIQLGAYDRAPAAGRFRRFIGRGKGQSAALVTSRTCRPGCPTCHRSFGSPTRERAVRDVVAEIRDLVVRRGVRRINVLDHAFDGSPARALEITRAVAKLRSAPGCGSLTLGFPKGLRGDGLTPELVTALVDAGVRRFPLAVGTASRRLQRLIKRNLDLGKVDEALRSIQSAGGVGHLQMLLGIPTETTGEAAHTIRWARRSRAHTVTFAPGKDMDLGPSWVQGEDGELDDFPNLRARALRSVYTCPRRMVRLARSAPFAAAHARRT